MVGDLVLWFGLIGLVDGCWLGILAWVLCYCGLWFLLRFGVGLRYFCLGLLLLFCFCCLLCVGYRVLMVLLCL